MLGGKIIRGDGIGRTLGFPTRATLFGEVYDAALVIMHHPWKVEAHLLDYLGDDMYGEEIYFEPIQRVSTLERYDTMEELKKKIERDIVLVRKVFEDQITNTDRDDHPL